MAESWKIFYTKDALKDKRKVYEAGFKDKIEALLLLMKNNPFASYPPYEKLVGDLSGAYLRRINHQHRLVYSVYDEGKTIKIISMWSHYE